MDGEFLAAVHFEQRHIVGEWYTILADGLQLLYLTIAGAVCRIDFHQYVPTHLVVLPFKGTLHLSRDLIDAEEDDKLRGNAHCVSAAEVGQFW
jgi:hypothetical protein